MSPTTTRDVAGALGQLIGSPVLRIEAFDGTTSGPLDAEVVVRLRSERGLRYLVTSPGELGLARAYVSGELEIVGEIYPALKALVERPSMGGVSPLERIELIRRLGWGSLAPLAPPAEELRPSGRVSGRLESLRRHTLGRDEAAISHHYDVSNLFYSWVLGPSMAYTCAVYPRRDASLEEAQAEKFDLVCRKLGLEPGMRLLDVGCGWGGMVRHAVRHYGVTAIGATLSRQQAEWGQKAIAEDGLSEQAEVRWSDYRLVPEGDFDAISSIGLTEHIGRDQMPAYFRSLAGKLRPGGRLLNHCIMRSTTTAPRLTRRGFINRYVFPDGELSGLGTVATAMQDNGFEIRHDENFREHYAATLAAWGANLEAHWDEAVREVGEGRARVWRLYMAGSRVAFEHDDIELHQLLGVRVGPGGDAMFPLRAEFPPRVAGPGAG